MIKLKSIYPTLALHNRCSKFITSNAFVDGLVMLSSKPLRLFATPSNMTSSRDRDSLPRSQGAVRVRNSLSPPSNSGSLDHLSLSSALEVNGAPSTVLTWYSCGPTVYDVSHLGAIFIY